MQQNIANIESRQDLIACVYSRKFPGEGASNDSGVVENCQRFCWLFLECFRDEASVINLYGDMQSVVGFSVIPKCVILNDPDWLFRVKICAHASLAG